jgi:hypothetical protein
MEEISEAWRVGRTVMHRGANAAAERP